MNAQREAIVEAAFNKFDRYGQGVIHASDLKGVYNSANHPSVISGDMTEDEAFLELLSNFPDTNNNGTILRDEWISFYTAVSSLVEIDSHFIDLMCVAWRL